MILGVSGRIRHRGGLGGMAIRRHTLKSKGTDIPPKKFFSSRVRSLSSQEGMLTFAEVAIGTVIIALLIVVAVTTLKVTEKGTVNQKQRQEALNLAKAKAEEIKSYLTSQNWDNIKVEVRFPPTQTPVVNPYDSYAPTTVKLGKNLYILDPEVRYVNNSGANQIQYVPTPGAVETPEISDLVRIRVDAYYGKAEEFVPLPTAEASNQ